MKLKIHPRLAYALTCVMRAGHPEGKREGGQKVVSESRNGEICLYCLFVHFFPFKDISNIIWYLYLFCSVFIFFYLNVGFVSRVLIVKTLIGFLG